MRFGRLEGRSTFAFHAVIIMSAVLLGKICSFAGEHVMPLKQESPNDPYCAISAEAMKYVSPGTLKMAELLGKIARERDPRIDPFFNSKRAEYLHGELAAATNLADKVILRLKYADELLNAGDTMTALSEYAGAQKDFISHPT